MTHNGSIDGNLIVHKKPDSKEIDTKIANQTSDQWAHLPECDPAKILINEKTVYAVDQSMNVVITDIKGNVLYGNPNIFDLTLYRPEDLIGKSTRTFNASFHSKEFFRDLWDTILSGKIWRGDIKNKRKDGKIIWVRLIITPLLDDSGSPYQFVGLKEDITEKKEMEFHLAQKDKQLSALTNNSYDIIGIMNKYGEISYLNPSFERILGFSALESIGSNLTEFIDDKVLAFEKGILHRIIDQPSEPILQQIRFTHKDGTIRWCDAAFTNYLADEHIQGIVFNLRDFTKQKEATDIVHHLANYDYLTGLPNRRHFENKLREALKNAKSNKHRVALLFLDLDGFKNINDSLGHEIGDGLLKEVADRINSVFHEGAFIGRIGGDEFSIIIPNMVDNEYLHALAESLVRSFSTSFNVEDYELNISASIGISIYPMAGKDMKTLLKNADAAMYQVKHDGKNHYQLYAPSMDQKRFNSLIIKNPITKALDEQQY